jgi:hypothetical protein
MIHFESYSAAQAGAVVKDVTCEKCGARFVYEMVRRASFSRVAAYGIGLDKELVAQNAVGALDRMLAEDEDAVACPACGWFQASMVAKNAKRFWNWTPWGMGNKIDPNAGTPPIRGHFPGCPTGILVKGDAAGTAFFRRVPEVEPDNVLSIRMFQHELPPCCHNCLGPAESETMVVPRSETRPAITFPTCGACAQRVGKRRLVYGLKMFALMTLLFWGAAAVFGTLMVFDDRNNNIANSIGVLVVLGIVGAPIGAAIYTVASMMTSKREYLAVHVLRMDWERLVCRVKFDNRSYLEHVRKHIGTVPISDTLLQYIAEMQ